MKRRRLTILSVLCTFLAPALLAQTGVVEGKVLDGASGAGISGVTAYFGTDQGIHYEAITGDSGAFHIDGMKPGEYGSHYEKSGYLVRSVSSRWEFLPQPFPSRLPSR
jgi:hypothetical protein